MRNRQLEPTDFLLDSDWLAVDGDVDDFIFFGETDPVSEK